MFCQRRRDLQPGPRLSNRVCSPRDVLNLSEASCAVGSQTMLGCERLIVNLLTESSSCHTVWHFRMQVVPPTSIRWRAPCLQTWEERAARRGGGRTVGLANSRVTLCSRLPGRSSSSRQNVLHCFSVPQWCWISTCCLRASRRHSCNPSDDPSRFQPLRSSARQRPGLAW